MQEAGNEGTISTSLIGKVRRDSELTGQGTAKVKSRASVGTGKRSSADSKSDARGAGPAVGGRTPAKENSRHVTVALERPAEPPTAGGDRARVLIRLESEIDGLLHEIKMTGGFPEFEETLRKSRRILVRSHGE